MKKKKSQDSLKKSEKKSEECVDLKDWQPWIKNWLKKENLSLDSNAIVFLEGEMGVGKSTWTRELLQILGFDLKTHGSPTFPIIQNYSLKGSHCAAHIDLYRLKTEEELLETGIEEILESLKGWALVEWSSLFESYFKFWQSPPTQQKFSAFSVKKVYRVSLRFHPSEDKTHQRYIRVERL